MCVRECWWWGGVCVFTHIFDCVCACLVYISIISLTKPALNFEKREGVNLQHARSVLNEYFQPKTGREILKWSQGSRGCFEQDYLSNLQKDNQLTPFYSSLSLPSPKSIYSSNSLQVYHLLFSCNPLQSNWVRRYPAQLIHPALQWTVHSSLW